MALLASLGPSKGAEDGRGSGARETTGGDVCLIDLSPNACTLGAAGGGEPGGDGQFDNTQTPQTVNKDNIETKDKPKKQICEIRATNKDMELTQEDFFLYRDRAR